MTLKIKDQRSNLSMWKNFSSPKVYNGQILNEDHKVVAAEMRKLKGKQISALSAMHKYCQKTPQNWVTLHFIINIYELCVQVFDIQANFYY